MSVYKTYKFYTGKNQRIAAFARERSDKQLEIFLLFCSPKDHFSRREANITYFAILDGQLRITPSQSGQSNYSDEVTGITYHPEIVLIPLGEKPKLDFIHWMQEHYFRKGDYPCPCTISTLYQTTAGGTIIKIEVGKPKRRITKMDGE